MFCIMCNMLHVLQNGQCITHFQNVMKQIFKQMKENNEKQESKYGFRFS